ncbi:MAG: hypothetical protein KBC05_19025 [Candidatus Hydrogenedentes bacterium]|nr:hypothetical protein [Candidatus Hydrogenedentota bacterium]
MDWLHELRGTGVFILAAAGLFSVVFGAVAHAEDGSVAEDVYRGELVAYPGPWGFMPRPHIILVNDEELETIASDPDKALNLATGYAPREESLRMICERAQRQGLRTLIVAFDQFFAQYRPGQDKPRRLTPDMDEYIGHIAKIGAFAAAHGLGLELSLLSPLEIGPAYARETGESGQWMHYRKGLRDVETGRFSVQLWRQTRWTNNKGPIDVADAGVRVFAFRERGVRGTPYRVVNPDEIVEITDVATVEAWDGAKTALAGRIRVHGEGRTDIGPLDRVLVVQLYRTPEMDYFSPRALPFLEGLVNKYADAGVRLNGLYADEMHIQQDWAYFGHHDHGEFALRYVSDGLVNAYAGKYGEEYRDFAKYLVYFVRGQEDFAPDLSAKTGVMHVFGDTPEAIRRTALFRARYYHLLQDGVVDLFAAAKRHAEARMGRRLESRAHATWAESPTIDRWDTGRTPQAPHQYEYTSNFQWSCTVHQAASACYDYFKWGDFLTGNGNDHAEGGWLDRNYFAMALACSTGILNEVPYSYAAHWGMPGPISAWRMSLVNTYGAAGSPLWGMVEDMQHRDVDVLMLYPLDLVAADERFGSWMTQYGYANYVSAAKLLECGRVSNGAIEMAGRRFTTLVALFEPFPSRALLEMLEALAASGGRVVWSGPPPVLTYEGDSALDAWRAMFGAEYAPEPDEGLLAPGRRVEFEGRLSGVEPQVILTDFLVDRIYPVTPRAGTEVAARVAGHVVGTLRAHDGGGVTAFLGYRPRDDQAQSLGYESRNWFEVLSALGAYPPTGTFPDVNDNTEHLSRTTDYLACRFPNGAVAVARHFRTFEEGWPGGFARKEEEDSAYMEKRPLPDDTIALESFKVNGHEVWYQGKQAMAFRVNERGDLIAFAGSQANEVTVDGRRFVFADAPFAQVAWAPVSPDRRLEGGALLQIMAHGEGTLRIPKGDLPDNLAVITEGPTPGSRGHDVLSCWEAGALAIKVTGKESGRWLWGVSVP